MTLPQVRHYTQALASIESERMANMAIAVRAGMAGGKDFEKWLDGLQQQG